MSRIPRPISIGLLLLGVLVMTAVNAHHSAAGRYDTTRTVEITGSVVRYGLKSPHSSMIVDVTNNDGSVERWHVELSSATNLKRGRGWDENTFKSGDQVTISGYPHRSGEHLMVGRAFRIGDTVVGARRQTSVLDRYPPSPDARGISGRWLPPWGGQNTDRDRPPGTPMPLNAAGRQAWDDYDPERSPVVTCEPMNIPTLFYPAYLVDIRVDEREAVLHYELYDVVRRIPLNSAPVSQEKSGSFGVATARMEGDTLVIESREFPPSRWGLAIAVAPNGNGGDIPSSGHKRLTERYTANEDGRILNLHYTVEDPSYLSEPFSDRVQFRRLADDAPMHEFECDPEAAAGFLGESPE